MKKTMIPALAVLSSAFVACGLVPDQVVKNPVGLKGQTATVTLAKPATATRAGLSKQAITVASTGAVSGSGSFADDPNLGNLPINPSKYLVDLDFSGASFTNCPASVPDPIAVEFTNFKVVIKDAAAQANVTFGTSSVTLSKTASGYSVTKPNPALSAEVDSVANLIKVLKEGGQNTATVTGTINTDKAELIGCTMSLTFGEGQGTIKF